MTMFSKGVGIDVSDYNIRLAIVRPSGEPKGLFELNLPAGVVVDDQVAKPKTLRKIIHKLLVKAGLSGLSAPTVILVPESRVFSTSIMVPKDISKDEFNKVAMQISQRNIPLPFRYAITDIVEGEKSDAGLAVDVYAVDKKVTDGILQGFQLKQLPIVALESNNQAVYTLFERFGPAELVRRAKNETIMIVDIGHAWTNISVYDIMSTAIFSRSILLRRAGPKKTSAPITREEVVRLCGAVVEVEHFIKDSDRVLKYIVLAGSGALQKTISATCQKGLPKHKIGHIGEMVQIPGVPAKDLHKYGAAIGAGLRACHRRRYRDQHNFIRST